MRFDTEIKVEVNGTCTFYSLCVNGKEVFRSSCRDVIMDIRREIYRKFRPPSYNQRVAEQIIREEHLEG